MRLTKLGLTPIVLLFLVANVQAGLVHRQNRNANLIAAPAEENLIPVQIIQDGQQLETTQIKTQPEPIQTSESAHSKTSVENNAALISEVIAEKIAEPIESAANVQTANALLKSEQQQDEQIIEQEIKQAILDENRELLQAVSIAENTAPIEEAKDPQQLLDQAQEINTELKDGVPAEAYEAAAAYFNAPESPATELNTADEVNSNDQLKSESLVIDSAPAESQNAVAVEQLVSNEPIVVAAVVADEPAPASVDQLRQVAAVAGATQATPTQTTTQPNFVQQLIQNSPLGQFFGQLSGQQQQQQLATPGIQVAADQPATPAPTLPGFLNPQNAITQVQNAAQSVANATAQAFQGVQQFANNLGTQFQNTLSSLSGQQQQVQLSTADATTQRPPGPIQSLISNFVGGNQPAGAAAAAGATTSPAQQGPFQGIISFLQGGNRPQAAATSGTVVAVAPAPAGSIIPADPVQVDNKVDEVKTDDLTNAVAEPEQLPGEEGGEVDQSDNEVRNSAEVGLDSLEDNNADQLIVVEDDASQQGRKSVEKTEKAA
ncbi:20-hydroxyecdysone protein [Bactrocera neohumeralis]|uniref:20-hydroxyecdysone protein n=1 Tax=Bactrocera neohumeralis TaxID=98809 RepID=UPI002166A79B|nr:20-hydroxyecdysone protein [Bactrocera neohumeralis]